MTKIILNGDNLTINDFINVARNKVKISLSEAAIERIQKSRNAVENLVKEGKIVYGLTTGFGSLANVVISPEDTEKLQENLITSHAVGVGKPLSEEIIRGTLLIRINTFCKGLSGLKLKTVETLLEMLNKEIYPHVPEKGSVGASGDLAPLSHLMLVLLGKGKAFVNGKLVSGLEAMQKAGIQPITLSSKEGLALNNGTSIMTSIATHSVFDARKLLKNALITTAMSFEALKANSSPLFKGIHDARPHQGQSDCATILRNLLEGSSLIDSDPEKVQDAYSLRAAPVVLGASWDTINYVAKVIQTELNSTTDNPLIIEGKAYSGANFHGQPIALVVDFLSIAVSEIGNISERRIARLVDKSLNHGLPAFLIKGGGLNSGFMVPQYTAAALVSENKILCHPSSVDSIPTCANQEDHVSMGTTGARKSREIITNVENIVAIELMCATQGVELREKKTSEKMRLVINAVREIVPHLDEDREIYEDIIKIHQMIKEKELLNITSI